MKLRKILAPVDVASCPAELFSFLNRWAGEGASVTLLYVSKLNVVAPENRLYREVHEEALRALANLRAHFLSARLEADAIIRTGRPVREIVAEAKESGADLIILTRHSNRHRRFLGVDIIEGVIAAAPCVVRVLPVNTWLNGATPFLARGQALEPTASEAPRCAPAFARAVTPL